MPEFVFNLPAAIPSTAADVIVNGKPDHVATALARLPEQFKGLPNIEKLLTCLIAPCQELEQAYTDLLLLRSVDTGFGAQLDTIGEIVGQPRNGVSDDELYRRYLRARIATNRSKGKIEDLIRISRLVIDNSTAGVVVQRYDVATVVVRITKALTTVDVASILASFLAAGHSRGVRLVLEWSESDPSATLTLDSGPGLDIGHLAGDTNT